jgi:hypothetical protein
VDKQDIGYTQNGIDFYVGMDSRVSKGIGPERGAELSHRLLG